MFIHQQIYGEYHGTVNGTIYSFFFLRMIYGWFTVDVFICEYSWLSMFNILHWMSKTNVDNIYIYIYTYTYILIYTIVYIIIYIYIIVYI